MTDRFARRLLKLRRSLNAVVIALAFAASSVTTRAQTVVYSNDGTFMEETEYSPDDDDMD